MKNWLKKLFSGKTSSNKIDETENTSESGDEDEAFWQEVYDARVRFFEAYIGELPDNILKIVHILWPGGGLFTIPATRLNGNLTVYTTFGLTNPDMPVTAVMADVEVDTDEQGRVSTTRGSVQAKDAAPTPDGVAGYGYEILIMTKDKGDWPLGFLQWAVPAELNNDIGFLERVIQYNGLTIEEVAVGNGDRINVLITLTEPPLPNGTPLPNGAMLLLVATVITDDEMKWSMEHGRDALYEKLVESGIGQVSIRDRPSVISA